MPTLPLEGSGRENVQALGVCMSTKILRTGQGKWPRPGPKSSSRGMSGTLLMKTWKSFWNSTPRTGPPSPWMSVAKALERAAGKGQGGKGKGQSLGKGKHRREHKEKPGIEQETDLEKVLKACEKARNMVSSCKADLELALEKAKSKLSKSSQSNAMSLVTQLGKAFDQLKACLQTKDPQVKKLKEVLMKVAKVMADARDETRSSSTWATRQAPQLQVRKLATEFGKAQGWKAHFGKDAPGSPLALGCRL